MTAVQPTEAQKEAGNYAKDHVRVHGLDVSIENRKGAQRSGTGKDGNAWSVKMPAHYGYIKGTVGEDGDHVDCYLGPHVKAPHVYVVDQADADTGKFDEHKCMIGFASKQQALETYRKGFSDGRGGDRIGALSEMTVPHFKEWLVDKGRKSRAFGGRVQEFAGGGAPTQLPPVVVTPEPKDDWEKVDDWAAVDEPPRGGALAKAGSLLSSAVEPITSYPSTYNKMQREAREEITRGIGQVAGMENPWEVAKGVGNVGLGGLSYLASPINAGLRTIAGKPVEDISGGYIPKEYTEFATGLAIPGLGLTRLPRGVPKLPTPPPTPPSIAGVTLTEGEHTRSLPLIQREQGALRGEKALGEQAHEDAQAFARQREAQLAASHENVARALDPYGQVIADTPIAAGQLVSEGVQSAARSAKAGVTAAYDYAKALPGEIGAGSFEGIAPSIKNRLSVLPDNPIIVDALTPQASKALGYLESTVGKLRIPNRASLSKDSVYGEVAAGNDAGITLRGIEQWRKNLTAMRSDAIAAAPTNPSDARAMRAIIEAFDDHVEAVVKSPAFRGDPRVVQAWLDARAAHADFKGTFGKQGGRDPVGSVVQKVIGDRVNDPAIASDVANFAFGASGVVPNSTNVGVARRFREILGAQSPEWSAVKQGLWSRLTEMPTGDAMGHKKIADRITTFLANPQAASVYYAPWQQNLMREYAEMHRRITVPQAGAQWSNNVTTKTFENISNKVGTVIGAILGGSVGKAIGLPVIGEVAGAAAAQIPKRFDQAKEARLIRQQMPVLAGRMQAYAQAMGKAQAKTIPAPFAERAQRAAAFNLDKSLRMFGTSLEEVNAGGSPSGDDWKELNGLSSSIREA